VIAVFIPALFMVGIGRALFPPLAMAVGFAMIASYLLSSTLVPVLAALLFRNVNVARVSSTPGFFARVQAWFGRVSGHIVRGRLAVVALYLLGSAAVLTTASRLGTELFPRVDAGQMQVRIRAPAGTRLERTVEIVRRFEGLLREEAGAAFVDVTLANIGNPAWTFPVNAVFVWNSGPHEALLLASLKRGNRPSVSAIEARLRKRVAAELPDVRFSFEAGDVVSQVLNFGAPTSVSVAVSGNKLPETRVFAEAVAAELRKAPSLRDVQIPLALDYPTVDIKIDRERAGQLGVTVDRVGRSIVTATSSSILTTPNFWVNPATGIPYRVAIRVPENQIDSIEAVRNLPIMPDGAQRPLLGDVATVKAGTTVGEFDHLNSQRMVTVTANLAGHDLGRAAAEVTAALAAAGEPPRGSTVAVRGQVDEMRKTLASLKEGLALSIVVVLLVLMAGFQSLRDALVVVGTVPAVLAGVVLALLATGSTLNVESMMGAIMAIGVAVANALLLVTFARERRAAGDGPAQAAASAAAARLRPIVMTGAAMIAGMMPMAIGLGDGGEQTAPLGRAVIGGLAASMIVTLLVVPSIYVLFARRGPWRSPSLAPPGADDNAGFAEKGLHHETGSAAPDTALGM
jgi:multidrug efflux pump subunit AcrB